ncbi:unnamed protein product, partial [Iphiclides podalirius]
MYTRIADYSEASSAYSQAGWAPRSMNPRGERAPLRCVTLRHSARRLAFGNRAPEPCGSFTRSSTILPGNKDLSTCRITSRVQRSFEATEDCRIDKLAADAVNMIYVASIAYRVPFVFRNKGRVE